MIKNQSVVTMAYTLKSDKGEVLDEGTKDDPLAYIHGAQNIIVGLEEALLGLKIGDKKDISIKPEKAYGIRREELVKTLEKSAFPTDAPLEIGIQFQVDTDQGAMVFAITGIDGDKVEIDGNHPLAGETLHFSVEILEVREATKEELSHGHVHGPGGHEHQ